MATARGGGLDVIVVDYLTRLRPEVEHDNPYVAISGIVKALKDLAMQMGVPLVLLSQLNRKMDSREDKLPALGDLRDSGVIVEESDTVMFLHRPHYYLQRGRPTRGEKEKRETFDQRVMDWEEAMAREKGKALVYVAKQRQGPIGPVRVRFDDENARFSDDIGGDRDQ
jgi:replicative DNA helicase